VADEAEDVVQEAYVRSFASLADFEGRARFSTWLTRICVHEALRRVRRNVEVEFSDHDSGNGQIGGLMPFPSHAAAPEERVADREIGRLIEAAIDDLPDNFRAVFVLRAVEELSVAETAACLDIPEETVKTRFFRARALLREDLVRRVEGGAKKAFAFDGVRCDRIVHRVLARIGGAR
jgi:RNA polymerase sigma-70 factor (ECF subfamily)